MDNDDERVAAAEVSDSTDARNAPQLLAAAEICVLRGEPGRAVRLARKAALAAPQDGRTMRVLSGIFDSAGQRDAAIEAGFAAARLRPDHAETRLHLGGLLTAACQWRPAAEHLAAYVAHPDPHPAGWRQLSSALHELGRTARAIEAVDQAIALAPANVEYRIHRASLLGACGRYGDALAELAAVSLQAPDNAHVFRALSGVHQALHELAEALANAEHAAMLAPDDPALASHLHEVRKLMGLEAKRQAPMADIGYWTRRSDRPARQTRAEPGTVTLLATQGRIVGALILREMRTRFGRTRLGYVWAILEPISHIATLGSVFSLLNHAPPPVGDHLFLFYLTGLLPFLMFGHVTSEVTGAFAGNAPVLQIPMIKRTDLILSRALLHLGTEVFVGIVVFGCAALLGWQGMPADLLTSAAAIATLWLLATGIGTLNIVSTELMPAWDTFFASLVRVLYFASGIYYSPIAMPEPIRAVLVWNPILQAVEWFRSGFYAGYQPHWLMADYVVCCALGAALLGFATERAMRRHVTGAA